MERDAELPQSKKKKHQDWIEMISLMCELR